MRTTLLTLMLLLAAGCEDRKAPETAPVRPTIVTPAPRIDPDPAPNVLDAGVADPMMDAGAGAMMDAGSGMMDGGSRGGL